MSTTVRAVPGFLPSTAGFHFANRWPSTPALVLGARIPGPVPVELELRVGDAANGLCGGMALAVLDRWAAGLPPPPDREPPPAGSARSSGRSSARQVDSLEWGLAALRFYRASASGPSGRARSHHPGRLAGRPRRHRRGTSRGRGARPRRVGRSASARREPPGRRARLRARPVRRRGRPGDLRPEPPGRRHDPAARHGWRARGAPSTLRYLDGEAPVLGLVPLASTTRPVQGG